jgi:hypothetical protein
MKVQPWMLESLGRRVALTRRVEGFPPGRTGLLVSLQSGHERSVPEPYATVAFDPLDTSYEENVPLDAMRPVVDKR